MTTADEPVKFPTLINTDFMKEKADKIEKNKEPLPTSTLRPVPEFDVNEMLPASLGHWAWDNSNRSGAPIEYAAVALLVSLGSLISPKVSFQPKMHDTSWTVRPNLWGVVVGNPSSKKSPALSASLEPLNALAAAELERTGKEASAHAKNKPALKARLEVATSNFKNALKKDAKKESIAEEAEKEIPEAELNLALAQQEYDKEFHSRRYTVNDSTIEALGEVLAHSPGVLQFRDEMTGWLNQLNKEDRANDRAFFLESFNGSSNYVYDRIGRGTLVIKHNILSLLGGIQPDKIKHLVKAAQSKSGDNDGLLQRFQMMVYPDYTSPIDEDREPKLECRDAAMAVFQRFNDMEPVPAPVKLDDAAYQIYTAWRHAMHKRVSESNSMDNAIKSHLGKYDRLGIALAGLFALIDTVWQIKAEHVQRAIKWCDFLEQHAERIYGLMDSADIDGAKRLMKERAVITNEDGNFKLRTVRDKGWSGLTTTEEVKQAIDVLIDYGHVEHLKAQTGGRPSEAYRWL